MKKEVDIEKTGFKTPDNYFDGIEDAVFEKIKDQKQLDSVNSPGFNTPETYFDSIEDRVLVQLERPTKVISLVKTKRILYITSLAAAAILVLTLILKNPNASFEVLDTELVENYIIEQELSTYELTSLLSDADLSEIYVDPIGETISDDTLENYLIDNVDLETFIEQ